MLKAHYVSVSKPLSGKKKSGWMCPPTWILHFTHPSIRTDDTSPPQSSQAALRVAELVETAKMSKKSKLTKHFPLFEQVSKKFFEVMK